MAEVQLPLHQKAISSRYPTKNILEIRGYSGGTSTKSIKFMDKPSSNFKVLPPSYLHINSASESINMDALVDLIDDIPDNDDNYSLTHQNHHNRTTWNEESNEGWTSTGIMSDRSSDYSIDDGEFDREASKKVTNLLKEIEAILYEQNLSYRPILAECNEWLEKFPHLRVLGNQVPHVPKEEGFYYIESKPLLQKQQSLNNNSSNTTNNNQNDNINHYIRRRELSDVSPSQGLIVNGTNMPVKSFEITDKTPEYKFLEEETYDEEGNYEELFAYDNREDEYLLEHNKRLNINKRRRRNLPPITPKAAVKDMVLNLLFDHIWSEIINWSSDTIKRYSRSVSINFADTSYSRSTPIMYDNQNTFENSTTPSNNNNNSSSINTNNNNNNVSINNVINVSNVNTNIINHNTTIHGNNTNNNKTHNKTSQLTNNNNNNLTNKNNIMVLNSINNNQNNNDNAKTSFPRTTTIQFNRLNNNSNIDNEIPPPPSRDSTIYLQTNKIFKPYNNENIIHSLDRTTLNSSTLDTINDPINGLDNFLKIKPFKSGNPSKNKTNQTTSNSRLGSGSRRQYPLTKRRYPQMIDNQYSSKAQLDTIYDKNIIVHGAAVVRPALHTNHNERNHSNNNHTNANHNVNNEIHKIVNNNYEEDRSAANDFEDEDNDDYYDASVSVGAVNNHNYGVENDNFEESISITNTVITNSRHNDNYNVSSKKLPPIENSLTAKQLRISSANNSKQNREKTDRPMTTTATRYDGITNRRVTTPLMQVNYNNLNNRNTGAGLTNLLANNIQITGIRFSGDDTNSNFSVTTNPLNNTYSYPTKSLAFPSQASRKNSIRDSLQNSRIHNK